MGYNTDFSGELKFVKPLTAAELKHLEFIIREDARDHKDWDPGDVCYMSLEVLKDASGLRWDGSEKTYEMVGAINLLTKLMRRINHNFELSGTMLAQGDEVGDVWRLVMKDGVAYEEPVLSKDHKIVCPHCHKEI